MTQTEYRKNKRHFCSATPAARLRWRRGSLVALAAPPARRGGKQPRRAPRLWAHTGVGFVEHEYLLATTGRGNGRWNGRQLEMA